LPAGSRGQARLVADGEAATRGPAPVWNPNRGLVAAPARSRPRRNDAVDARIGDALPQMLAEMLGDGPQCAAPGAVLTENLDGFVRLRSIDTGDHFVQICERFLELRHHLRL